MVGKDAKIEEFAAEWHDGAAKTLGVPNPTEGGDRQVLDRIERRRNALLIDEAEWGMARFDPLQSPPGRAFGHGSDCRPLGWGDQIGSREDDDRRAPERTDRLTQQAAREQMLQAERLEGVNQHQVNVVRKPAMLKAVVEHDQLGLDLEHRNSSQRNSVGPLEMRNVGQVFLEHPPFVIQSALLAITTAENRDADSAPAKPARDPLDHGGFSGTAQRQVSHRDNGNGSTVRFEQTPVETEVAQVHDRTVSPGGDPQARPDQ